MSRGCESLSLLIYAAFQQHICINLPETSLQASCCHALWFPIHHHHPHLRHQTTSRVTALVSRGGTWQTYIHVKVYIPAFCPKLWNVNVWDQKKKSLFLERVKYWSQKESVFRMLSGLKVVLGNFWKMVSPQATRRLLILKCCGLRFHILSLALYFPFTSLPSVLVYTIWQLYFSYRLPALICRYMHSDYKI